MTQNNDYQQFQASSAENAARNLGVDLEIVYADNDGLTQSQQILKAIQSPSARPDAIIFQPAGTPLVQVAQVAVNAGIGWALLNREADYAADFRAKYKTPVFSIGSDHFDIGKMQGHQFGALLPSGGIVLYIQGSAISAASELRVKGMNQTKPDNIEVRPLRGKWTEESAYKAVIAWLSLSTSKDLPLGLVGCQNDAMAIGARRAFHEHATGAQRKRLLNLPFTGCDGCPGTGREWVRKGLLTATVVRVANAALAMEMMVDALRTGVQPPLHTKDLIVSYPSIEELVARDKDRLAVAHLLDASIERRA